jgi:lambda repressor-like predicted transcriptional regulator
MNRLSDAKRVQVLSMLCEGSSMRSVSRVADVSINTVAKLLADEGEACEAFHDETVRGVRSKRVQCDEIWALCYAKQKNVVPPKRLRTEQVIFGHGPLWMPIPSW